MLEGKLSKIRKHIHKNKRFYTGATTLTLAATVDVALTTLNIGTYGSGIEYNSPLRTTIDYHGIHVGLLGTKALGVLALTGMARRQYDKQKPIIGDRIFYGSSLAWSLAALSNLAATINPDLVTIFK